LGDPPEGFRVELPEAVFLFGLVVFAMMLHIPVYILEGPSITAPDMNFQPYHFINGNAVV
jgi:hypothetical protein